MAKFKATFLQKHFYEVEFYADNLEEAKKIVDEYDGEKERCLSSSPFTKVSHDFLERVDLVDSPEEIEDEE